MSNQLTIRENQAISASPSESEFAVLLQQADMLTKTGFLPASIKSKEQALAIILTGRELGIPAMAALNTINVIQQKPTVSPQLMLALIERSGQLEDIRYNITEKQAVVTMKRVGRSPHSETFTEANAQSLGLLQKQNWKAQKTTMLKWRAVAACARVVFADVILGIYLPDEMGDENLPNSEMQSNVVVKMPPPQNFSEEVQADFIEAEIENHNSGEIETTAPTAVPIGQRIDESQELIAEVKWLISELGKKESDFNDWFQKKYESAQPWEKASIAVKRELVEVLHKMAKNQKVKAA